jgi:hypothetical protein
MSQKIKELVLVPAFSYYLKSATNHRIIQIFNEMQFSLIHHIW